MKRSSCTVSAVTRIVKGGGTIIFPMVESAKELSLELMSFGGSAAGSGGEESGVPGSDEEGAIAGGKAYEIETNIMQQQMLRVVEAVGRCNRWSAKIR